MIFDDITHKVIPESIENKDQALAYWYFLESEVMRHSDDIESTEDVMDEIRILWNLEVE